MLTAATSHDERDRAADVAVLPIGSFEQHGQHLPLATDTFVASVIAKAVSDAHSLFLLPPITISCSHEHAGFAGTVSITATTLASIVQDVSESLSDQGIRKLVLVSGHGGNYVLSNVAQQLNVAERRMLIFPGPTDWTRAREAAGCESDQHTDMHGGELETSILLQFWPQFVSARWAEADRQVDDRSELLLVGMRGYTDSGVIGLPSLATPEKGKALVEQLMMAFIPRLARLRQE